MAQPDCLSLCHWRAYHGTCIQLTLHLTNQLVDGSMWQQNKHAQTDWLNARHWLYKVLCRELLVIHTLTIQKGFYDRPVSALQSICWAPLHYRIMSSERLLRPAGTWTQSVTYVSANASVITHKLLGISIRTVSFKDDHLFISKTHTGVCKEDIIS